MQEATVKVLNVNGIHCRPSSAIVRCAMKFKTTTLRAMGSSGSANLKSMIEIITLALHCGDSVTITAEGDDEVVAIGELSAAFTTIYDYPDK
jgi:phosphotransferase system HPr (HPr) family protein